MTRDAEAVRRELGGYMQLARLRAAFPTRVLKLKLDPASSWVQIDMEPAWGESAFEPGNGELKFAVWRSNGSLYWVGETGAVDDDPIPDYGDLREWVLKRCALAS